MRVQRNNNANRRGFTLIEVLLVLAIIGVIAAFAVPTLIGQQQDSYIDATKIKIRDFENIVQRYTLKNDGVYPEGDAAQVAGVLMQPGSDKSGRPINPFIEEPPKDAWGNPLFYEYPPSGSRQGLIKKPAIWSAGPDQTEGSEDDVINWTLDL